MEFQIIDQRIIMSDHQIPYQLIETRSGLEEAVKLLAEEKIIGVDLEADSLYHYREKVCLIQIATETLNLAVDPLTFVDLSPLRPVMADPGIRKVFHGADYDIRSLYRDFQIEINNLFDTQLACRFLGVKETGLEALLRNRFQVTLNKKYQKGDWSARPLSSEMLEYGIMDVLYLIPLARVLGQELMAKNRLPWVEEENAFLSRVRAGSQESGPLFMSFKGASVLDPRSLAVLEALLQFRKAQAEKMDRPPFKVLGNEAILELARQKPLTMEELTATKILSPKQITRFAQPLLERLRPAAGLPESDLLRYPRGTKPKIASDQRKRIKALKAWRDAQADHLGIDPSLLLNNAIIHLLAEKKSRSRQDLEEIPGLKTWQKEAFGQEFLAVLVHLNHD
jgi:ribonuclease D